MNAWINVLASSAVDDRTAGRSWHSVHVCLCACDQLMVGEWKPPDVSNITGPPADNSIIGHVIQRLFNIARPPTVSVGHSWRPYRCLMGLA